MKIIILTVVAILAVVGAVVVFGLLYLILSARRHAMEHKARTDAEAKVVEAADWIGTTGLDEATERELPRYLRRERGESLFDEGSLKAEDLRYVGAFQEEAGHTHFWHVPDAKEASVYAYVVAWPDGGWNMGWGDREPPGLLAGDGVGAR